MKRILQIAIVALVISSCTTIYYDVAQPKKVDELTSFPEELIGWYIMDPDTVMINVDHYSFPVVYQNSYALGEIDTNDLLEIKDGLFYDHYLPIDEGLNYTITNDSLHYKKAIRGSKFLSDSLVLKKFEDYFVLSEKNNENEYWTVMLLAERGDDLVLKLNGKIKSEEDTGLSKDYDGDLKELSKITKFKKLEKNTYLIKPNKKKFKKLVDAKLFSVELDLIRITNDSK